MSNSDKAFYDSNSDFDEQTLRHQITLHRRYFDGYKRLLKAHFKDAQGLTALELGAGSCILSLLVKQELPGTAITALDISARKMQSNASRVAALLGTDLRSVTLKEG